MLRRHMCVSVCVCVCVRVFEYGRHTHQGIDRRVSSKLCLCLCVYIYTCILTLLFFR
jgi:hypothetical protein